MRVVAALSGGVDSSVAALILRDAGHDVTGVYLRNGIEPGPRAARAKQGCCGAVDAADAARVADRLGIPFYSLDYASGFESIIAGFAADYARGRTPNPCILCNRDLKFGELLRFADAIGADAVATGHYAVVADRGGRRALRIPADTAKDQTYVLFPLDQAQLRRTVLPLAGLRKDAVREKARGAGLPVAEKPESMEICFVPGGDYRAILAERAPDALRPGALVDEATGAEVGRHGGVGTVTIGQRRGLGAATGTPQYVTGIDPATGVVRVGAADACLRTRIVVSGWNAVSSERPGAAPVRGRAKVRRNHPAAPAAAIAAADGRVEVRFDEPVRAPAPGQALVLYDDDGWVLGGGWIDEAFA